MTQKDSVTSALETLKEEIDKAIMPLSDKDMEHLREIYRVVFCLLYDPDNDACAKYGEKLYPHIKALNVKFHFKK